MKKFWKNNQDIIKYISFLFVIYQALLVFLNYISPKLGIVSHSGYKYFELKEFNPRFFWNWANFDGIHYLDIARKGYGIYQQAFFPLYPNLIKFITPFFMNRDLLAGIFISNLSLFIVLFLFYKLISLDYPKSIAQSSLLFFLFFPASFFLGIIYTESLFLVFVLGSFYFARKNKWFLVGIFGALASYTRLVGIFLFPALLYEWWLQNKVQSVIPRLRSGQEFKVQSLLLIFIIPLGLLTYMRFLWQKYNDPLMFFHIQSYFGGERTGERIILIYQVFWRYLKMILTTKLDLLYLSVWFDLITAILFLFLIFFAFKKGIRKSYLIFAALAYIAPSFSGTFSSLPRYALILFPCYICLSLIKSKSVKVIMSAVFALCLIIFTLLFFRGYWVA